MVFLKKCYLNFWMNEWLNRGENYQVEAEWWKDWYLIEKDWDSRAEVHVLILSINSPSQWNMPSPSVSFTILSFLPLLFLTPVSSCEALHPGSSSEWYTLIEALYKCLNTLQCGRFDGSLTAYLFAGSCHAMWEWQFYSIVNDKSLMCFFTVACEVGPLIAVTVDFIHVLESKGFRIDIENILYRLLSLI